MTKTFAERCKLSEQCLPDAPYRAMLTKLHTEMLAKLAEQPAQQEPVGIVKDLFTNAAWDKLDVVGSTKVYLDFPPAQQKPFGYFKAEPFGWTDCTETDDGAIALYTAPQAQPAREPLMWRPMETAPSDMRSCLFLVNGFCVQGFIDATGAMMVQSEISPHWRKMRGKPTNWMPLPPAHGIKEKS